MQSRYFLTRQLGQENMFTAAAVTAFFSSVCMCVWLSPSQKARLTDEKIPCLTIQEKLGHDGSKPLVEKVVWKDVLQPKNKQCQIM